MEIINFLIGQLVGLVEPFLAIDFIIKCLGWKEGVRHRKQLYIGVCLIWFIVAQGNGRFAGSYNIIAAFDMCLAYLFMYLRADNKHHLYIKCYAIDSLYYQHVSF